MSCEKVIGEINLKKISLVLTFTLISIVLFSCQQNNKSNIEGAEKVNIYEMKSFSEITEESLITITDLEEINSIEKAIKGAEKVLGIVDVLDPHYQVDIREKTYYLWIHNEESGTIMDAKDTNTVYTLSNKSVKKFNKLINNK